MDPVLVVRHEAPGDIAAIEAVVTAAFQDAPHSSHTEHFIVKALRQAGQLPLSLIAEEGSRIVGHVAVSPVTISNGASGWFGLGPVSVAPDRQGKGIGSQLIELAMTELRRAGAAGCVVLGEPRFYSRFGFQAEPALVLPNVPPQYFQALAFTGTIPAGTVTYHGAFHAVS